MRPLRLEMTGIGPFLDETLIDFDRLPGQSLFLIHGATGRGKSFIFDAICYALYGQTPSNREQNLKSDFAETGQIPRILFAFELADRFYRVERTLAYERAKKRGDGVTEEPESLRLERLDAWPNGKPDILATRKSEVQARLRELIGLDLAQFKQVVLLPQGEFRQLLLAGSQEREELLENLFDASFYQSIQRQVEDRSSQEKKANHDLKVKAGERLRQAVEQLPEDLRPMLSEDATATILDGPLQAFRIRLEEAAEAARTRDAQRHSAASRRDQAKTLLDRFLRLDGHRAELRKLQEQTGAMAVLQAELQTAEKAVTLLPLDQQCRASATCVTDLQNQVRTTEQEFQQAAEKAAEALQQRDAEVPALEQTKRIRQRHIHRLEDLHAISRKEAETAADLRVCEDCQKQANDTLTNARREREDGLGKQKEWRLEMDDLSKQSADQDRLKLELDTVKRYKKLLKDDQTNQRTLTAGKKKEETAAEEAQQALISYQKLRDRREANLATELAAGLKADTPCPVCGSREHPAPAAGEKDSATPEMVAEAEKQAQEKNRTVNAMRLKNADLAARLDTGKQAVLHLQDDEKWLDHKHLDDQMQERTSALKEAVRRQTRLIKLRQSLRTLEDTTLPEKEVAVCNATEAERLASEQYIKTRAALQAARKQLQEGVPEELQEELGDSPTADAMQKLEDRLADEFKQAENRLQQVRAELDQANTKKERNDERRKGLNEQLLQLQKQQEKSRQAFIDALRISEFADEEKFRTAQRTEDWLQATRTKLREYKDQITKTEALLNEVCEAVGRQERPDLTPLEEAAAEAEQAFQSAAARETTMKEQEKQLNQNVDTLLKWNDEVEAIRTRLQVLGRLDQQLRGQGQPKISLKRFFLAQRLEEVLLQASRRMQVLSNGRFVLKRAEGGRTAAQQTGLDLLVHDAHTGTERPVNTLSGGQLFLASLAMALGLADVVQARSGGIRLDTLFIDEGFGSLDEETLELAMKVLNELRRGRMVGVISHVTELRRQIANRIEVSEANVGSRVTLHVEGSSAIG